MNYYFGAFKKYAVFSGRASRSEYWYYLLFNILVSIALTFLDFVIIRNNLLVVGGLNVNVNILTGLYALATLIPGLALSVRRMHDIGKSGWMLLVSLIPLVGFIWLIVLMATDSNPGENKFGPNPKSVKDK